MKRAGVVSAAQLEGDFEEMESRLVYLETLCYHCEQQTLKQEQANQLEVYKRKKRSGSTSLQSLVLSDLCVTLR